MDIGDHALMTRLVRTEPLYYLWLTSFDMRAIIRLLSNPLSITPTRFRLSFTDRTTHHVPCTHLFSITVDLPRRPASIPPRGFYDSRRPLRLLRSSVRCRTPGMDPVPLDIGPHPSARLHSGFPWGTQLQSMDSGLTSNLSRRIPMSGARDPPTGKY